MIGLLKVLLYNSNDKIVRNMCKNRGNANVTHSKQCYVKRGYRLRKANLLWIIKQ